MKITRTALGERKPPPTIFLLRSSCGSTIFGESFRYLANFDPILDSYADPDHHQNLITLRLGKSNLP